ncbi:spherulation-specific family 4 protein [Nitrosomonas communis]|uniref:Spherulation-specific family 4 n=1 Tax=Nitrosomonas communis TaxID=44574 RepID=A0A1H2YH11_9PROT|nr:spherulation-specific family 4 protein [Nitrosomonas communis]SDX03924.1 Spherulation-specific family 4 [Nitrosomonas communis]
MSIKHFILLSIVYLLVTFGTLVHAANLFVPAYFHPSDQPIFWSHLVEAAQTVPTTVIFNPNNGPGISADPSFTNAIDQVREAGGKVIAYVKSNYGERPMDNILQDIDSYIAFYAIDGFFIDEKAADGTDENIMYYETIYNYIKNKSSHYSVTGNPGVVPDEVYLSKPVVDDLVVFENTIRSYVNFRPENWQHTYPKDRFIHIVYDANSDQMKQAFNEADKNHAGHLYITNDRLSNPYDSLPQYGREMLEMSIVTPK